MKDKRSVLNRRKFIQNTSIMAFMGALNEAPTYISSLGAQTGRIGNPLQLPVEWKGDTLSVKAGNLSIWPDNNTEVYAINGSVPGPTIRVRRGREFEANIINELPEELVLHWHGILAPERMDGHPRDAVKPGQSYAVKFPINQRPSTCWYHAHTDKLTAEQVYAGVAGLFIVEDTSEDLLGLPNGDHDIPLVLADRRSDSQRQFRYAPTMMDYMNGYLGDIVLVNGTPDAWLSVDQGLYRFRLLNGSNARVFRIGLSDNHPFHLIASDGGLLAEPIMVNNAMLAPGERMEILVDFKKVPVGGHVVMKSLYFQGSGGMMGGPRQGDEMDLIRIYVDRGGKQGGAVPSELITMEANDPSKANRTRIFNLLPSGMMRYTINGKVFEMERTDFTVPWGEHEIWEYRNLSIHPHPMHMHGTHFQILDREGQSQILPEDMGWKDTVLVNPGETLRILIQFDTYPGLFLHHCHNLEHEDQGMMQNYEVSKPPTLEIRRTPPLVEVSWDANFIGWTLESTDSLSPNSIWHGVAVQPQKVDGKWHVALYETEGRNYFRLKKVND